ncbi:hypothetical protein TNCV_2837661 [Trichonephila clavipes]|nr:hypothetical protein TNCV_2837661 [Trichonephila clavipes]
MAKLLIQLVCGLVVKVPGRFRTIEMTRQQTRYRKRQHGKELLVKARVEEMIQNDRRITLSEISSELGLMCRDVPRQCCENITETWLNGNGSNFYEERLRVSAAEKRWMIYPLDPRPDVAVALYSGCTPGKRYAWFLPDDRHTASLVGLRGGWWHARMKFSFRAYGSNAAAALE